MTNEDAYEELKRKLSDKYWRLNHLYYIKDKSGKKVKFNLNQAQEIYHQTKHNRNLDLKARQIGFTTYACIDALDNVLFIDNFDAGIIAHNLDDAEKIFTNKVKYAFDNLPDALKQARRPSNDRAGELRFPNGSSISVSTSFRGGTLRQLHVSEFGKICAKYPEKAREIVTGAFNAVPFDGEITIESTAEGMSGYFFEMCEKAQNYSGELSPLDFKFHFFSWWQASEYRLNPIGIEVPDSLKKYFEMLQFDHGIKLDAHQKAWYVKKSEEQGEDMHREYPSYPEEAFRASGRPVFNLEKLGRDIKRVKDKTFDMVYFDVQGIDEEFRFPLKVFKKPLSSQAYAIGGDVAEGLEDGDSSTMSVIDKNFEQVAVYKGKIDPDLFGKFLVAVARFYNTAILAPEVNNAGIAVIESIKRERYFKVYKREVREELGKDIQDKIGWHTNMKTKMLMLDELKAAYRDDSVIINCHSTLREMMTLTIEEDGNVILNSKDQTVALAISIQALKQASISNEHKAITPAKAKEKDVTKMELQDKLRYYKRIGKQ